MPTIIDGLAAGQRKAVAHVRGPDLVRSGARDQLLEDDDADEHDQEREIDPARSRNSAPDRSQHWLSEAEQDAIQRGRRSTRARGKPREDRSSEENQEIELQEKENDTDHRLFRSKTRCEHRIPLQRGSACERSLAHAHEQERALRLLDGLDATAEQLEPNLLRRAERSVTLLGLAPAGIANGHSGRLTGHCKSFVHHEMSLRLAPGSLPLKVTFAPKG
jgi:hypothetical protein